MFTLFIVLQMARCDENVKAVNEAGRSSTTSVAKRTMARTVCQVQTYGLVEDDKAMCCHCYCCGRRWCKQVVDTFFRSDDLVETAEMLNKRTSLQRIMKNELSYKIQKGWRSLLSSTHEKFLVWCNILAWCIYGYFHRWNSWRANYRKFLVRVHPFLHGHDLVQIIGLCQDGRPHRTADVFKVLNEHFSDRIIGLDYPPRWYQSGPIFTSSEPLRVYLGLFESKCGRQVLQTTIQTTYITTAVDTIDCEACSRVMDSEPPNCCLVKDGTSIFIINCPMSIQ
ncbi:hypothetical protein NPIL_349861 [Nephila pilipes]|uniref:Uncharacterized protein n=1 Tax=Nephila pilipes TaxID=299642 RepID=A0A8X6Q8C4_NEPPI|nr:hypothetical protein NPIL_349861 [Nephila pilipes]